MKKTISKINPKPPAGVEDLLSRRVYLHLLKRILSGEFLPGQILNRRKVAAETGASVAPVLEAMLELETEGFLETLPRRGTQVRLSRPEEVRGQMILREALECQAARLYRGAPILQQKEKLQELARELDKQSPGAARTWKLDIAFHRELVSLTKCDPLVKAFDRTANLSLFYSLNLLLPQPESKINNSHTALLSKLWIDDADVAERAIREHIESGKGPFRE